jgi:ribosomal protein S18 acetylase RimI-like enzyme
MIQIRRCKIRDLKSVVDLQSKLVEVHQKLDAYWGTVKDAKSIWQNHARKSVYSPNALILVAEEADRIVGYVMGYIKRRPPIFKVQRCGEITDIFVSEAYRRKGVGQELVDGLIKWFKSKAVEYVEVKVDVRNKAAVDFWHACDFEDFVSRMKKQI